jgi:hypothetical protein
MNIAASKPVLGHPSNKKVFVTLTAENGVVVRAHFGRNKDTGNVVRAGMTVPTSLQADLERAFDRRADRYFDEHEAELDALIPKN